jgi:hypothetical protein
MEKIIDLWAIIWPIIKSIFKVLGIWDILEIMLIYIVVYILVSKILKGILPRKHRGNMFMEALHLFVDVFIIISPFIGVYHWLKGKIPLVVQLASYVVRLTELDELVNTIMKVFLVCMIAFGVARGIINLVSLILQKFAIELPYIGDVIVALIRVAESMFFVLTVLWLPFFGLSFFKQVDPYPVIIYDAIIRPPEANEEIWRNIEEGVQKAHENGVECDPYLLYSLKIYETGNNICTQIYEYLPRPNECVSIAGCLGDMQFDPETYWRNATRYNVEDSLWEPPVAVEVGCYFINDEVKISLAQTRNVFIRNFAYDGLIWNRDPAGAGEVYDRAIALRKEAFENSEPPKVTSGEYLWPAPKDAFVWYPWGVDMWYGKSHNGIDIAMSGLPAFKVHALDNGNARYWDGGSCNAGVITLQTSQGDEFHYVHMEWDTSKIAIPTDGEWHSVKKGQTLGWILDGDTSCSRGNHLHLMFKDGRYISGEMFQK